MLIHDIIAESKSNGPGTRFTVWVQGCSRHCDGCFNPDTWKTEGRGIRMTVDEILTQVPGSGIDGVTVSGGEPFEQSAELAALLEAAHQRGLNTLVYTGYTYHELCAVAGADDALKHTDILIDGAFDRYLPRRGIWTGSGNQRVLLLRDGVIMSDITDDCPGAIQAEVLIDERGVITATGIGGGNVYNYFGEYNDR